MMDGSGSRGGCGGAVEADRAAEASGHPSLGRRRGDLSHGRHDDPRRVRAFFLALKVNERGLSMVSTDPGNWTGGQVGKGKLKGTKYGIAAASYPARTSKTLPMSGRLSCTFGISGPALAATSYRCCCATSSSTAR
ncbi:hypothetical protein [Roseomonas elaeocarpi]|uniref:Transposase IS701-like DDE domain-containing protein n=1 Tax=Roseomonas elaeocarpi TaxID=907779 RepID=A0ABV6JQ92_9PROT